MSENKNYGIYATLHSEVKKGTVWTYKDFDDDTISLMKITNTDNKKSIIVAYRLIESNFEKKYNESKPDEYKISRNKQPQPIIIDDYYRKKLGGLKTQKKCSQDIKDNGYSLKIEPVKLCWYRLNWYRYRLKYLREHSDEVVRITYWLAQLSIIISLFSYFISTEKLYCLIKKIPLFFQAIFSC